MNRHLRSLGSALFAFLITLLVNTNTGVAQTHPAVPAIGNVRVEGHGPVPAILIPGYTCDSSFYDRFMHASGDQFTFYAITLAGFGGTPAPAADSNVLDDAATAIARLVDDRHLDHPVLIGHSLGAELTYRILAEHPDDFRAAICIDGLPAYPIFGDRAVIAKNIAAKMRALTPEEFRATQEKSIASLVTSAVDRVATTKMCQSVDPATAIQYLQQLTAADYTALLSKVKTPLLLMVADSPEYGQMTSRYDGYYETAAKAINHDGATNCKITRFIATRHFIMLDNPAGFRQTIVDFVSGKAVPDHVTPTTESSSAPSSSPASS